MKPLVILLLAAYAAAGARSERYALILEDQPLAAGAASREEMKNTPRRSALLSRQNELAGLLRARGVRVTGSDQTLVNALFVEAAPGSLAQLRSLPGVVWAERLRPLRRHLNEAVNLMNVPAAWSAVNGSQNAGTGVKIAVLDTGIDQTHAAFQDSSLQYPAGFPKCDQARGECGYVNTKVIAARSYVNLLVGTDPQFSRPDDITPRDRSGHGTAMAMAAAGVRNTGPAGTITGVAPRAWLGNYKVFGSPGVNGRFTYDDVILQALRDAMSDGMDIAVLALGAPAVWGPGDAPPTCGPNDGLPCDWRASAVENAVRMGLTVVVSAGNSGDAGTRYPAFNSIETPGTAPSAITVGASTNSHILYQSVRVSGPGVPSDIQRINAQFSDGPKPPANVTGPVRDAASVGANGRACSPFPSGSLAGTVALIERGDCQLVLKIVNAQKAGAIGAIIYQPAGSEFSFPIPGAVTTGIPAVSVGNRSGVALKNYAAQQTAARVTLDPSIVSVSTPEYDTMAFFSSRGPSIRNNTIKPELVATGTDLYTAAQRYDPNGDVYDASGYTAVQGTSFSAALVAGAVAMVKQLNPRMTPAQLKSAVVNTTNPDIEDVDGNRIIQAGVLDMGAGKLDASAAVRTNVTAEPATLSFGVFGTQTPAARTLKLCNFASGNLNLRLSVLPGSSAVRVSNNNLTVNAGACREDISISLNGSRPAPGVYEGEIQVTGGAVPLRIPVVYLVTDGVPFTILPLEGNDFDLGPGEPVSLSFKVVDRYGIPIANLATQSQTTPVGDGTIRQQGTRTDDLGIGYADASTGQQVGELEFYSSAGSDRNFGIYFTGRVRARPAIAAGGIVDAVTFEPSAGGFAPGSYITLQGSALSDVPTAFQTPYLPLALAGVSVSFDVPSNGLSVPGRLTYASENQINVLIPWELQGSSSAQVKVSIRNSSSTLVTIPIAAAAPSVYFYAENGQNTLLGTNAGGLLSSSNPARRGDVIVVYANGLGAVDAQPQSGEPAPTDTLVRTRTVPAVTIGGTAAEVLFSGLAPGYVGLYQMNIRVPQGAATGVQPLVVTTGAIASKAVSVPVQ